MEIAVDIWVLSGMAAVVFMGIRMDKETRRDLGHAPPFPWNWAGMLMMLPVGAVAGPILWLVVATDK